MSEEAKVEEFKEFANRKREFFDDIPAVDTFAAKPGTAVHELAGAARYWHKTAQAAEQKLDSCVSRAKRDGFIAGIALSLATTVVAYLVCHFTF